MPVTWEDLQVPHDFGGETGYTDSGAAAKFVAKALGGQADNDGLWTNIQTPSARIELGLHEDPDSVTLESVLAHPTGTGEGTRVVEALKQYADRTGKRLHINNIVNEGFVNRFPWLNVDQDGSLPQGSYHSPMANFARRKTAWSFPGPEYLTPGQRYTWWGDKAEPWIRTGEPQNFNPGPHITWATYLGPYRHEDYQRAVPEIPNGHAFRITQGGYDGRTKLVRATKDDPSDPYAANWENLHVMDEPQLRSIMERGLFQKDVAPGPINEMIDQMKMQQADQDNRWEEAMPTTVPEEWGRQSAWQEVSPTPALPTSFSRTIPSHRWVDGARPRP